jgi:hypothetical protein
MDTAKQHKKSKKLLFKVCHRCLRAHATEIEPERCPYCLKAFLPHGYFQHIHQQKKSARYQLFFQDTDDLDEEDLVKGLNVLW